MSKYDRDMDYLIAMHLNSKKELNMTDQEIKDIAKSAGDIHPAAMRDYLAKDFS